ncbi:MAG: DUF4230 domain-containing protein [Promicromonosporaceae bacterium]|nr:DUF4230 domain-containing protein [Promicromonosporaceae bacterium]
MPSERDYPTWHPDYEPDPEPDPAEPDPAEPDPAERIDYPRDEAHNDGNRYARHDDFADSKRPRRLGRVLLAIGMLLLGLLGGATLATVALGRLVFPLTPGAIWEYLTPSRTAPQQTVDILAIQEHLREISELATATYAYSIMTEFTEVQPYEVFGYEFVLPFDLGAKGFWVRFNGEIKVGFDMYQVSLYAIGDTLTIYVPHAKILSHEIAQNSIQYFYERQGWLNPLEGANYEQAKALGMVEAVTRMREAGTYALATENFETQIAALLLAIPGIADHFTIEFNHAVAP